MTQQKHNYTKNRIEERATWRRKNHAHIEAMQNLIFARASGDAGVEFKTRLRAFISALQSSHGGGEVINEPFSRGHLTVASYLQFGGNDEAKEARVRRLISDLEDFQERARYRFLWITRGGEVVGQDTQGNDMYSTTEYIDVLKPVADEAVMRARDSVLWKGDATQKIKAHPGRAMEAQVDWALSKLPPITKADAPTKPETKPLSLAEYRDARDERVLATIEKWADGIEERHGDDDLALEWLEVQVKRIRESRLRTRSARHDDEPLLAINAVVNATTNTSNKFDGDGAVLAAPQNQGGATKMLPLMGGSSNEGSDLISPNMQEWALFWASRGIPVFPLHEVYDGICTCACSDHWKKQGQSWVMKCEGDSHVCGSECESKGKHPRNNRKLGLKNGLKVATLDPAPIRLWWSEYPTANIGGRMLGKIGLDIDPKHGGDASLFDLCERFGQEWLATWRNVSGSGGDHFIFDNPTGEVFKNSAGKLGLGVDTRGDDGYLVMPPSLHACGERYAVISPDDFRPFPQELIDLLLKPKAENDIEYQDKPQSSGGGWGEKFMEGQRNDGLLAYAIGRMRHAWERTEEEFYQQLSRVNRARCVPPLDDDEIRDLAAHIANDYAHLYGVSVAKQEAA